MHHPIETEFQAKKQKLDTEVVTVLKDQLTRFAEQAKFQKEQGNKEMESIETALRHIANKITLPIPANLDAEAIFSETEALIVSTRDKPGRWFGLFYGDSNRGWMNELLKNIRKRQADYSQSLGHLKATRDQALANNAPNTQALAQQAAEEAAARQAAEKQRDEANKNLKFTERELELARREAELEKRTAVAAAQEKIAHEAREAIASASYEGAMYALNIAAQFVMQHPALAPTAQQAFQGQEGGFHGALQLAYYEQAKGNNNSNNPTGSATAQQPSEIELCERKFGSKFDIVSKFVELYNQSKNPTEKLMAQLVIFELSYGLHQSATAILSETTQYLVHDQKIIPTQYPQFAAAMKEAVELARKEENIKNAELSHEDIKFFFHRVNSKSHSGYGFIPADEAAKQVFGHHDKKAKDTTYVIPEKGTKDGYRKAFEDKRTSLLATSPTLTLRTPAPTDAQGLNTPTTPAPEAGNGGSTKVTPN